MNKIFETTMKHAARLTLLTIVGAGAFLLLNIPKPETAHAATLTPLASSNLWENSAVHYSLKDYRAYLGTWATNWPTRSPSCPPNATGYKTFPWQPSNVAVGYGDTGDNFTASGNCANRYVDAGSYSGAWAVPWAMGGWAYGSGSGGFGASSYGFSSNLTCYLNGKSVPVIWGSSSQDYGDQAYGAGGLMGQNGYSTAAGPYGLFSNGTSFFRNNFNVVDASLLTNVRMYFQADDWMRVYLNGNEIITTTYTSTGGYYTIPSWYFVTGNNLLAIQVTDKAIWNPSDPWPTRGMGICYNVTADVLPPPPPPDVCPNLAGNQASIPAGYFKDGSGNCVPDVCPNIAGGQASIPPGYFMVGANCVPDVCPNITGGQASIPPGMVIDIGGNCVPQPLPPVVCTTSDTIGECVVMNGQLYINPPKFFDNTFGLNLTQSQGERPPLY